MSTNDQIMQLSPQHKFFILGEEELSPNLIGFHKVQVDAGQTWLLFCDGQLTERLGPGRHTWWNGFFHKWRAQRINSRVELLSIPVKGRVKGPAMQKEIAGGTAVELACEVTASIEITCKLVLIENFLSYRDPLSVFTASIQNMVVEFIGSLSYDEYGKWAVIIRDLMKDRLGPGGRDDAERRIGIHLDDIFVTDFKPNTVHDRSVLAMYQLIERGKRELVEAQSNMQRDTVVAESYAKQGDILNIAPSILALQDSPVGKALIERDADLRKLMVATGLNPGVNVQPIQEMPGQLTSGQTAPIGYLNQPRQAPTGPMSTGEFNPSGPLGAVTGQIFPAGNSAQSSSMPLFSQNADNPPVDEARQKLEISNLENAGFKVAGAGQVAPAAYVEGQPLSSSKEWVLQVYHPRPGGYLEMIFHCPAGYPAFAPKVEVRPTMAMGRQWIEPNAVHQWNPGLLLTDVAREIADNIL